MQQNYNVKISKYLSYILRHKPSAGNISLDKEGWVDVNDIIQGAKNGKIPVTLEEIQAAVEYNPKKRFELNGKRIRAVQGHSVKVEIKMEDYIPDGYLYHGTIESNVNSILKEGLKSQSRIHVHLSKDIETASNVGMRRGKPIVLQIDARKMRADGLKLYEAKNGVVLVDEVPPQYITRLKQG